MRNRLILAASGLILSLGAPALAQSGGTRGSTPQDRDVRAGTSGYGSTDGRSITVGGTADAEAREGGTANTRTRANVNERRGMQHSTAKARDDDERARSRTHTIVRQGEVVRSRTSTMYKQKGERPVRTNDVYRSDKPKK
jgi:hypothetical protein